MQVNSINFKGFSEDYKEFSKGIHESANAIKDIRHELIPVDAFEKEETDKPNKKSFLKAAGSLAFITAASYVFAKKAYNLSGNFIQKIKDLPNKSKNIGELLNKPGAKKAMEGINNVKDNILGYLNKTKDTISSKVPDAVKNSGIVKLIKNGKAANFVKNLNPETKVGLAGAVAGTIAVSKIDKNENGCSDMFENGISALDGVVDKFGHIANIAKALS